MEKNSTIHRIKNVTIFSITLVFYNLFLVLAIFFVIALFPLLFWNKRFTDLLKKIKYEAPRGKYLLHGASVGEHSGTLPLTNILNDPIYSVNTTTGLNKLRGHYVNASMLPWDLPLLSYGFIKNIDNIVLFESEFLPNLIFIGKILGKKIYILNGRISQRRFLYYRILKGFYKELFHGIGNIVVANREQCNNFQMFSDTVRIIKNTKYLNLTMNEKRSNKILLFASTHSSDEIFIKMLLDVLPAQEFPIVLAPRHMGRLKEILHNFKNFNPIVYKNINVLKNGKMYIVNSMGIMNELYENSFLTFMGGTFDKKIGGHNPLEPISFQSPIVYGEHYENFKGEYELILKLKLGKMIRNPHEIIRLFNENPFRNIPMERYKKVLEQLKPSIKEIKILFNNPNNLKDTKYL
ncbi:hypothetical protein J7L48_00190 [bacterium]|nr:hypothetical protein [bacterium]